MSYLLVILSISLMLGMGVEFGAWVVLAYGIGLVLGDTLSLLLFYVQMNSWLGMDNMSFVLVMLSLLIFMISVVSSAKDIKITKDLKEMSSLSMVEAINLVIFCSVMFFSVVGWMEFFFFFEFSLIPTLFLILKWGYQPERLQAGVMMMMYTVSGSFPLLIGLLYVWSELGSDNMLLAKMGGVSFLEEKDWIWVTLFLGFLVKLPIYGCHGWLPNAHVEAPLSGSMLLSGILLKFGGYGIVRVIWVFEVKLSETILFLMVISMWGGLLSSCICMCQNDMKSLIAYSSIGHMALCVSGFLSYYPLGKMACICMFFAHGLCSPILFSLAASSYDLSGSRNIILNKGMLRSFPFFSGCWFLFCILNMSFPPSLNFFSEVFCISGIMWYSTMFCVLGGMMCFMVGCYCLVIYSLLNHGSLSQMIRSKSELSSRYLYSCVFVAFILLSGVFYMDFFFV